MKFNHLFCVAMIASSVSLFAYQGNKNSQSSGDIRSSDRYMSAQEWLNNQTQRNYSRDNEQDQQANPQARYSQRNSQQNQQQQLRQRGQVALNEDTQPAPFLKQQANARTSAANESDAALANRIRVLVQNDTTLSPMVRRLQISSDNGVITIRGVVATDAERTRVENIAKQIAGAEGINNRMTIQKR